MTKNLDSIETSVFRKMTNFGKIGLDLLHRNYDICISSRLHENEFQKISIVLEKNGFFSTYINWQIRLFLAKKQ